MLSTFKSVIIFDLMEPTNYTKYLKMATEAV